MKDPSNVTKAMRILRALSGLALLAAFLSGIRCATTALSTRSADKPVKVFELGQRLPRNSKILGISDTSGSQRYTSQGLAIYGGRGSCRYRPIIGYLKKRARALGGDAAAILHVRKPLVWDRCFTIKAFLLDLIDIGDWPRIPLTEEEITLYLSARGQMLDDIEGIWASQARSEVTMDDAALKVAKVYEYTPKGGDPTGASVMNCFEFCQLSWIDDLDVKFLDRSLVIQVSTEVVFKPLFKDNFNKYERAVFPKPGGWLACWSET